MPPSTPSKDSLSFALGELSGTILGHSKELEHVRQEVALIPSQVVASMAPRMDSFEAAQQDHGRRIGKLERIQWLWEGGRLVGVFIVTGLVIPLLPYLKGGPTSGH